MFILYENGTVGVNQCMLSGQAEIPRDPVGYKFFAPAKNLHL